MRLTPETPPVQETQPLPRKVAPDKLTKLSRHGANPHKQQLQGGRLRRWRTSRYGDRKSEIWMWKSPERSQKASSRIVHAGTERILPPPRYPFVLFPAEELTIAAGPERIRKEEKRRRFGRPSGSLGSFWPAWRRHAAAPRHIPDTCHHFRPGCSTSVCPSPSVFTTVHAMDTNLHELTTPPSFLTQLRCDAEFVPGPSRNILGSRVSQSST
jgi:hypothetical protein